MNIIIQFKKTYPEQQEYLKVDHKMVFDNNGSWQSFSIFLDQKEFEGIKMRRVEADLAQKVQESIESDAREQ